MKRKIELYNFGYEIFPVIEIDAGKQEIWEQLINVEDWWVESNDEHISLSIDSETQRLQTGTKLSVREKIAGIPCKAKGKITKIEKNHLIIWDAVYYVLGLNWLKINAGVKWVLEDSENSSLLTANVWAHFLENFFYKIFFSFFRVFKGVERDYDHAMKELIFLKNKIEKES